MPYRAVSVLLILLVLLPLNRDSQGVAATAVSALKGGKVVGIVVTSGGSGYTEVRRWFVLVFVDRMNNADTHNKGNAFWTTEESAYIHKYYRSMVHRYNRGQSLFGHPVFSVSCPLFSTRKHANHVRRVCADFQDDDVKVTIDQPDAESAGSTPVAFVEGRMNCAAATAVMDMQVRVTAAQQLGWCGWYGGREAWHPTESHGTGLRRRCDTIFGAAVCAGTIPHGAGAETDAMHKEIRVTDIN